MTDFYKELELKKEQSIEEINEELNRLESVWRRRETVNPEKAAKMIALLIDAKKVFKSEEERYAYDLELEKSYHGSKKENPDDDRNHVLEKWTSDTRSYYESGQYDLAQTALERALSYVDRDSDNSELFRLAANIYLECGRTNEAMKYINEAIVSHPEWPVYYIVKAQIYESIAFSVELNRRQKYIEECRNILRTAVSKAVNAKLSDMEGRALGMLAYSLYFQPNPDKESAQEYAYRAKQLGELVFSPKVVEEVEKIQEADRRQRLLEEQRREEEEKRRKEEEYRQACVIYEEAIDYEKEDNLDSLKKAHSLFNNIYEYFDAGERARKCNSRIAELMKIEEQRIKEDKIIKEEEDRKKDKRMMIKTKFKRVIIGIGIFLFGILFLLAKLF